MSLFSVGSVAGVVSGLASESARVIGKAGGSFLDIFSVSEAAPSEDSSAAATSKTEDHDVADEQATLTKIRELIRSKLVQAGIDDRIPIECSWNSDGQAEMNLDHPQRAEIEDFLRQDPEIKPLVDQLRDLVGENGHVRL